VLTGGAPRRVLAEQTAVGVIVAEDDARALVAPGDSVTPGNFNQEGNPRGGHSLLAGQYGEGSVAFFALLHQWREDGRLAGLAIL